MKTKQSHTKVKALLATIVAIIITIVPFHAFLTVWLGNLIGHYILLRLWKEILLVILVAGVGYLFVKVPKMRWDLMSYKLPWLIGAYTLVQLLLGIIAVLSHQVSPKALGYGWIVNLRFLIFFLAVWALTPHILPSMKMWRKWVMGPLIVVVLIGLLQYFVLPYDILKHVGYSQATIYPYETINHNIHNIRIMSTLRGANPLGAYLVVALSLVAALWYKHKKSWQYALLMAAGLLTLFLTFSRSAWIGLAVSLAVIMWAGFKTERTKRLALAGAGVGVIVAAGLLGGLHHNTAVQDALFHTDEHSKIAVSSNENHASALRSGLMDMLHQPFGRGPGTAGPASPYNTHHPVRIAENYFIQIGQETGWIGLLLFLAINVVVGRALWRRRNQTLALGLFASLIGISIVNLLSHAWADDTLAYLWWGLAGMAIAVDLNAKDEA